ncbi:ABC transporter permease [Dyella terrae]|uniref:ABC transporter permease n=1 Tax=Dyella terrae TaxID=522259 RepID=UPI001EFD4222|nr:ABC transporter permease [Dyella terrae]ULU27291.1 ABC transporter permease [Dyella terrae]
MFAYYLQLGLRSLRKNPLLTLLMVLAIGCGVAASMTTYSVFRATSNNPIPEKSSQLYVPQIDNWGPDATNRNKGEPPNAMTYTDAINLMRDKRAKRQTALYPAATSIVPTDPSMLPFRETSYAWYADAFSMFDIPFIYGHSWTANEDESHAAVAVIGKELNDKLFNGANSVGKNVNLNGRDYRIVGVADKWNPEPVFYDVINTNGFDDPIEVFIPFTRAVELQTTTNGNNNCSHDPGQGWDSWIRSECVWLGFWAELPTKSEADAYRAYLNGYAAEQQRSGRFQWAPNTRLRNVTEWLEYQKVVPQEAKVSLMVSLGFLLICLVNTVGLLLAKFMRRSSEIGVRRALGAPRKEIYLQFLIEAAAVGLAGGVVGLLLTGLGVMGVSLVFEPDVAKLAKLDLSLVLLTMLVAVLTTVLAAFYPTWRAAQVQPAWQLKSN